MKRFSFVGMMLALLAGCQMVTVSKPLPPAQLTSADRAQLEGSWLQVTKPFARQVFTIHFECEGMARVATVEWREGKYQLHEMKLVIADERDEARRLLFLQLPDKRPAQYLFMHYKFVSEDELLLWLPRFKTFEDAVKTGRLKGKAYHHGEDDIVRISDPAALLSYIEAKGGLDKFMYRNPMVLHKVADAVSVSPRNLPKCK